MRGILTFIGGLAVGILALTGVYAMEEEESPSAIESDGELELEEDVESDEVNDDDAMVVR